MMIRLIRNIALAGVVAAIAGVGVASVSHADMADTVKQRQDAMKGMGKANKTLKAYSQKGTGSAKAAGAAAAKIADTAGKIPSLFPKGTSEKDMMGKTYAKVAVWTKRGDFEKAAATLKTRAEAVVAAAKTGDQKKVAAAFGNMAKACGGCHKPFRTPKPKKK
jgi:cytochrome c556